MMPRWNSRLFGVLVITFIIMWSVVRFGGYHNYRTSIVKEWSLNSVEHAKYLNGKLVPQPGSLVVKNYNLRNMGPAASNEELEILLNIRKLIVFAVSELNRPLLYTSCIKWWANPLDLISYEQMVQSESHAYIKIKFLVQPGHFPAEVTIKQKNAPIDVDDTELTMATPVKLHIGHPFGPCFSNETLSIKLMPTCICSTNKNAFELGEVTKNVQQIWNLTDPELLTWRPTKSFSVGDYMNFTDYEWFVTSPGNTKTDIENQKYSSEYCGPDVKMLVMISSAPNHFKQRRIIRETFGSPSNLEGKGIKLLFLMGITSDTDINLKVISEAEDHKDIIQANFEDSYHNLTISHLSMYKWIQLTCEQGIASGVTLPKHMLKADDDFLLNVDLALMVADANPDEIFIGVLFCGTNAIRDTIYMYKYYTPRYMMISGSYAGYLSGVVYLMRTDIIPRLLHMSITTPIIHMDDAYVSGLLLRQLQIFPRNSQLFTYGRAEPPDACFTKSMVSSYVMDADDMTKQWIKFIEPVPSNCTILKDIDHKLPVQTLDSATKRACFFE